MATSMELLEQGERFRVVDPPSLPQRPEFPNRLKFCGWAWRWFCARTSVAGAFELLDGRLHDAKEIRKLLPAEVIGEIPEIVNVSDGQSARRKRGLGGRPLPSCSRRYWRVQRSAILRGLPLTIMYKRFYNLQRNPFDITPDPSFLFPTKKHNEALAALYYGVKRRKGFVVLTGEVGTGKTVLVRCLLQILNRAQRCIRLRLQSAI